MEARWWLRKVKDSKFPSLNWDFLLVSGLHELQHALSSEKLLFSHYLIHQATAPDLVVAANDASGDKVLPSSFLPVTHPGQGLRTTNRALADPSLASAGERTRSFLPKANKHRPHRPDHD